ncbi:MAG: shikimate kinase [Bdellovibrionales bacterium]|nr:shikimate kinase [Bdellovibrionales bacterium]
MRVFLCGFMGAGKSTVGQELSEVLKERGVPIHFVDADREIERRFGKTIPEIFKEFGETKFRELEKKFFEMPTDDAVVALGGGSLEYVSVDEIKKLGKLIYLECDLDELVRRLLPQKASRPLISKLKDSEIPRFVTEQLKHREKNYRKADFSITVMGKDPHDIAIEILNWLESNE